MVLHLVPVYAKYSETFIWDLVDSTSKALTTKVLCSSGQSSTNEINFISGKDTNLKNKVLFKLTNHVYGSGFFNWRELNRFIRVNKPKVIHAHFGYFIKDIINIRKVYKDIKCVISFHGTDLNSVIKNSYGLKKALISLSQDEAVTFTFPSFFLKESYLNIVGSSQAKLPVIPNAVNPLFVDCWSKPKASSNSILCVARLESVKGIDYLIGAARILKLQGLNYEFKVIGEGDEHKSLSKLVKFNDLQNSFHFLGRKTQTEIVKYLKESNLYVQPSITLSNGQQESFGVSALEAAVSGIPVIVTDSGGLQHTIDRSNTSHFIVEEKNSKALAEAIVDACELNEIPPVSEKFINKYERDNLLNSWLEVYDFEQGKNDVF